MKAMYTAQAMAKGGRAGHVETGGEGFSLDLAMPKEMGGQGGAGTNPEQLFAAGYAACFQSAMMFVGQQQDTKADDAVITNRVSIGERQGGPGFALAVAMEVELPSLSQEDAERLVEAAHEVCPYSNAIRGNVDVDFTVRGTAR